MKNPTSSNVICCCVEGLSLSSLFSWTGFTEDRDEEHEFSESLSRTRPPLDAQNENAKTLKEPHRSGHGNMYGKRAKIVDHPPPVIALTRSSLSFDSTSSADSVLTYGDDHHAIEYDLNCSDFDWIDETIKAIKNTQFRKQLFNNSHENHRFDYATCHEVLINNLFDEAKQRHERKMNEATHDEHLSNTPSHHPRTLTTTKHMTHFTNSAMSVATRSSRHSRNSRSTASSASDLLSHSSHIYRQSLKRKRGVVLKRQKRRLSSRSKLPPRIPHGYDESSNASLSTVSNSRTGGGKIISVLLHSKCKLQKDQGKGVEPGSLISARGREETVNKLVEKMIILAELEQEGSFANATLTRIPAKEVTFTHMDNNDDTTFIETRSMLAVKMGFVNLRYGVLVRWNKTTGLAELIVLRKMCPESFMKFKTQPKSKLSRKKLLRNHGAVYSMRHDEI
jgi:hypothetical protein